MDFWGKQGVKSIKKIPYNVFFWALIFEILTGQISRKIKFPISDT